MPEEKEKPMFLLGIIGFEIANWSNCRLDIFNSGIPEEIVVMQLKSLLKNYENKYFNKFNNKLLKEKKKKDLAE